LRKKVLKSKYGSLRSLTKGDESLFEFRWWKDLKKVSREGESGKWFIDNIAWKIGM